MSRILAGAAAVAALLLGAGGCAPPVLTVRHTFGPDLPIPRGSARVALADFTVTDGPADEYGPLLGQAVAERLQVGGPYTVVAEGPADLAVGAEVSIAAQDIETTRTVRRWKPEARCMETIEVPALVRTASVRATFEVRQADGERLAAAEVPATYRSTQDPRTRGPLGLDRGDDPANIPPADTIVRELLASCADRFVEMLRPREATVRISLRPAPGADAAKGLEAARRGKYEAAAEHFREALRSAPQNADLLFNLGAVLEADGRFPDALAAYEQAVHAAEEDVAAAEGAARARRAIAWPR